MLAQCAQGPGFSPQNYEIKIIEKQFALFSALGLCPPRSLAYVSSPHTFPPFLRVVVLGRSYNLEQGWPRGCVLNNQALPEGLPLCSRVLTWHS